jgi:TonB-linked SusC/RagA family outer membrane protein
MKQKRLKKGFYHYLPLKRLVMILFAVNLMASVFAQEIQVSGTVNDNTGQTMPGVNVLVEGTTTGTITNADGKYTIKVQPNSVLVFSFIGYISEKVTITGQSTVDITLNPDVKKMEEVVVIGYGVQRKEAVTGSVASVKADAIHEVASSDVTQAIQGRVAGVDLEQNDSRPGASMQIRIRGVRSLNATNDPLIVLDGIPFAGSISDINPSDIKSLDILKDASATAIYGSRGANGVLLITTYNGQKGQEAHVTYNGYYGVKDLFARFPMMSGPEFAKLRHAANKTNNTLDESDSTNTDWQKLLYRTGTIQNHDINISGSTNKGHYSFGVGYYYDQAVVPLQDFTRYSMRATIDQEIGKYLRVGINSTSGYSITNGATLGTAIATAGALNTLLGQSPLVQEYNADGSLKQYYQQASSGTQEIISKQMLNGLGDKFIDETRAYGTYNSLFGEVKIPGVEGLKYRVNVGLNYRQSNYGNYVGYGVFSSNPTNPSNATIQNEHTINSAIENLLTYDHTFADKHKINAVALYSAEQNTYWKSYVNGQDIPSDMFQFYNMGEGPASELTIDPNKQLYQQSGLLSYMGRVMYSYNDCYMLSATYRSDASSRLATGHKWHSYPALSAGWNVKQESFMKDVALIDMLKLRVGYGQTSNQSINPYQTLGLLSTMPYNYGSTNATGFYVTQLPNPNLGWEFSKTWNYGIDFALLKNRLTGSAEYYIQNTDNVLLSLNMPPTSGVTGYTANIGSTQNKGFEFSLNGVILDNPNGLRWEAGVNLYLNRNKLTALASGQTQDQTNYWFVGHPINVIYDYKKIGLWQQKDSVLMTKEQPGGNLGMIRVLYTGGFNADGTPKRAITPDDRQIMSVDPDYMGGFNTNIAYKGFDLSIVGSYQHGGILISNLYGSAGYLDNLNARATNNVKVDYWTPTNTGASFPKPGGQGGDNPQWGSTLGYFDASYLKVRNITLGYNFTDNWVKSAGISKLRIYLTVQNPFVFFSPYKDLSGMDPTPNSNSSQNASVPLATTTNGVLSPLSRLLTIGTNTPQTRNYMMGISLIF